MVASISGYTFSSLCYHSANSNSDHGYVPSTVKSIKKLFPSMDEREKDFKAVMIGDDVVNDIGGAQSCGIRAILVRTGKYRPSDETHPQVKADGYVDNLAHAVDILLASGGAGH